MGELTLWVKFIQVDHSCRISDVNSRTNGVEVGEVRWEESIGLLLLAVVQEVQGADVGRESDGERGLEGVQLGLARPFFKDALISGFAAASAFLNRFHVVETSGGARPAGDGVGTGRTPFATASSIGISFLSFLERARSRAESPA